MSEVIPRLSQRHPARAIVLLELEDGDDGTQGESGTDEPPGLDAWVTAACYISREGGRQICWEQVTVPARGDETLLLRSASAGLMVPDLPTVLWWPGQPDFEGQMLRRLGESSDLLIVDSAGFPEPVAGLTALARLAYDGSRNYGLSDLNWARLAAWRDMTAEFFDDPGRLDWLPRIGRVDIAYGSEDPYSRSDCVAGPAAARALLFAGWLAGRLGWSPEPSGWEERDGDACMRLRRRTSGVQTEKTGAEPGIELHLHCSLESCGPMAGLSSVTLEVAPDPAVEGSPAAVLSLAISPGGCVGSGRVRQGDAETLLRTYDLTTLPEDRLLADEIDFLSPDAVYEEALLTAANLATLPGAGLLRRGS